MPVSTKSLDKPRVKRQLLPRLPAEGSRIGRPPMPYDPEVAEVFLEEIAEGTRSMGQVIDSDPLFFPSRSTIWKWLDENPEFARAYGKAKARQVEGMVDDTTKIAEDKSIPVDRARLMITTRTWVAERLLSKKYGPRLQTETLVNQAPSGDLIRKMTPDEREQLRGLLLSAMSRDDTETPENEGIADEPVEEQGVVPRKQKRIGKR